MWRKQKEQDAGAQDELMNPGKISVCDCQLENWMNDLFWWFVMRQDVDTRDELVFQNLAFRISLKT